MYDLLQSFRKLRCIALLIITLGLFAGVANAQLRSSSITGKVIDATGAIVPNAEINITQEETNISTTVISNSAGDFTLPYLAPGKYSVVVRKQGFNTYKQTGIALLANETARVDALLKIGSIESTIEVQADATVLQTENSVVQGVTNDRVIENIPNANQNPLYYATLQAGVVPRDQMLDTTSPNSFGIGFNARRNFSAFAINGGSAFTNEVKLDGVSVGGPAWGDTGVLPNTDGLQEVRVIQNNYTAEYGRGQGVVSMTTKSGTNQIHGSVYYRNRNEALNANTFDNNLRGISRGAFKVNDLGFTLGGPVLLPKIYNGKDKLFFFVSYENMRHKDTPQWLLTVPTALEKKGDFSKSFVTGPDGRPVAALAFDPFSVQQVGTSPTVYGRTQVPNSIFTNPNPYALKIMSFFPDPNRTPDNVYNSNNYFKSAPRPYTRSSLNTRADYRLGNHSLYFTGGIGSGEIKAPRPYGNDSPFWRSPTYLGSSELTKDSNPYGSLGDTFVISPTLVADIRYGVNRINSDAGSGLNSTFDYNSVGMPKNVQALIPIMGAAPNLNVAGNMWGGPQLSSAVWDNKQERDLNHQIVGSMTKITGSWNLKWGGEYRVQLSNYVDPDEAAAGLYGINNPGDFTSQYVDAMGNNAGGNWNKTPQQGGFGLASMFGGAGSWSQTGTVKLALAQKYAGLFSQNDWRATRKLTLNFGLRWDWQPGPTERYNRISGLDLNASNAFNSQGAYYFPGRNGSSRNLWDTQWNNFQPRLGFAYNWKESVVIRGGYGITYLPTNTGYYTNVKTYGSRPFISYTDNHPYGLSNQNGVPVGHFWDAAPTVIVPGIGANPQKPQLYGNSGDYFFTPDTKNGHAQQWNLFIEKRLKADWMASIGYAGTRGDDLQNTRLPFSNIQLIPQSTLQQWRATYLASGGTQNPDSTQVANPFQPASGQLLPFVGSFGNRTISALEAALQKPLVAGQQIQATNGFSNYHSLQAHVSHAFSSGFQMIAHYTWSKSTDFSNTALQSGQGFDNANGAYNNGNVNITNFNLNKKLSFTDVPHRFVVVGTYELPFGRNKLFDMKNPAMRGLFGGWSVGAVAIMQSGQPLGAGGADQGSLNGRQFRTPGAAVEVPAALQHWYDGKTTVALPDGRQITPCANCFLKYNPDAFHSSVIKLADGTFIQDKYWVGTAAADYGDMRGPGRFNLDLNVTRSFRIKEVAEVQFVANATNALNHTQFQSGSYNMDLGSVNLLQGGGLLAGTGSSSNYGTHSTATYDSRQLVLELRVRF